MSEYRKIYHTRKANMIIKNPTHEAVEYEENGVKIRTKLRYCDGETSLIPSKQSGYARPFKFRLGTNTLISKSELMSKFIEHTQQFKDGMIYVRDIETIIEKDLVETEDFVKSMVMVMNASEEEIYNVSFLKYGVKLSNRTVKEIRQKLYKDAQSEKPTDFQAFFKDGDRDKLFIAKVLFHHIIEHINGKFFWFGDRNTPIHTVPIGRENVQSFQDFLQTNEGKNVKKEIMSRLENPEYNSIDVHGNSLMDIKGIGKATVETLRVIGINNVEALSQADANHLQLMCNDRKLKTALINFQSLIDQAKEIMASKQK